MSGVGYHNRGISISAKIYSLLCLLDTLAYDEVAWKIEYWIDLALTQQLTTVNELVEQVSFLAWTNHPSQAAFARFLKEFRDSPCRSTQARSFVDEFCTRAFWWFAAASAEDLEMNGDAYNGMVASGGGWGFIEAASFVGHLIERGLLDSKLVRAHLIMPLTTHHYPNPEAPAEAVRANAICRLFLIAGDSLLQGLLEPEDVWDCFEILETQLSRGEDIAGLSAMKLEEFRELHSTWLDIEEEEVAAEIPTEVGTPVVFTPQDLPITTNIGIPSPISHGIESSLLHDVVSSPGTPAMDRIAAVSSPTLSISTISDLTPTELGEDTIEGSGELIQTRHETFYLEDGNVEIVCGHTIFRVHSSIVSFSSPNLRDTLSPSVLLSTPMTEGCPRVISKDSAEDFAVLLKMIYTPGFPAKHKVPEFTVFASLLRMVTKYGFYDVREALVEDLKGAYPTSWEDFKAARVLGEDFFGLPKPHPNAVLNLLSEQRIKFALPFAAYRAGLGGPSSLASGKPGTILPRLTLASIIHGMGEIRRMMTRVAYSIAYARSLSACAEETCVLNPGANPMERRTGALKKISEVMVKKSEGDMLSSLEFGNLVCANCAKALEDTHLRHRERFVWRALPSLLVTGGSREGF